MREEKSISYECAEEIRHMHHYDGIPIPVIAKSTGLDFDTIKKVLLYKIHKSEIPAKEWRSDSVD